MNTRRVLILCCLASANVFAKSDTIPTWLDTLAPVVLVEPPGKYHSAVFHVTFKANKQASFWYRVASPSGGGKEMREYRDPVTVTDEGTTRIYFYAEDILGNKSSLDSMTYVLDSRPPSLTVSPDAGRYRSAITIRCSADKPCRFLFATSLIDTASTQKPVPETLVVRDSLSGYFAAVDSAGNRTYSRKLTFVVDSTAIRVDAFPPEGVYGTKRTLSLRSTPPADIFFTFDPSAPPRMFMRYQSPVELPSGSSVVRYFAKNSLGWESDIQQRTYVVDTVPPRLKLDRREGSGFDTLVISARKPSTIRYTLDGTFPNETSPEYTAPLSVARKGKCRLKASATDRAGNKSELLEWEYRYDTAPPVLTLSRGSGFFSAPLRITVSCSKPAAVYYTLDGSRPQETSALYKDGIMVTKNGATLLRVVAVDDADNTSEEARAEYTIDVRPPEVRARVEEDILDNRFVVKLSSDEDGVIRYQIDGMAGESSPIYKDSILLRMGQTLRYFAVDRAGNRSEVKVMDDLKKPIVAVAPAGGLFGRPFALTFVASPGSAVYYRLFPDTVFSAIRDSVPLAGEGTYTLEYYSQGPGGLKSPLRRSEFTVDMTPPSVAVVVRKGVGDSVSVFFDCNEKAALVYTLDGSNPVFSNTAKTAGGKDRQSKFRVSLERKDDARIAFFAEDAAGNQSPIRVLDVFKPAAVPDVPAGRERVYDHALSITLNTFDNKSIVHYARHGRVPTVDSAEFSNPITLTSSDTIMAFAVDPAGYRGQIDTFVYLIDMPPSPAFSWSPATVAVGSAVTFDASASVDAETPHDKLDYRWDMGGTGVFTGDFSRSPQTRHTFASGGRMKVSLQVRDAAGHVVSLTKEIVVLPTCPPGMVSFVLESGGAFCIDIYEWPNIAGDKPLTSMSWVQAKISCLDADKRLCTREEWTAACKTMKRTAYPYGQKYERRKCPSEGKAEYKSGSFPRCGEKGGARDMVGNVWEWVEDRKGDYPLMLGGSFRFGKVADCGLSSEGSIGLKSGEVGFRCCK